MIVETGSYLRDLRVAHNKTQKQMSELFGVCRGTYSSWESRYKNKALPVKVCDKFHSVIGILNMAYSNKYVNAILFDREEQKKLERKFENKKESIWKRILRWLKN